MEGPMDELEGDGDNRGSGHVSRSCLSLIVVWSHSSEKCVEQAVLDSTTDEMILMDADQQKAAFASQCAK
jgi:hypothetical protein